MDPSHTRRTLILDSWPLAEGILRDRQPDRLTPWIEAASRGELTLLMSEINLGELFYLVAKTNGVSSAEKMLESIARTPLRIVTVREGEVLRAARLKAQHALSYADCFCANLAVEYQAAVLTGDPDFLTLQSSGLLRVEWVGA